MKTASRILLAIILFAALATPFGLIVSSTTMSGPGAPTLSCSATSSNLGRFYVRTDGKAQYASVYACVQDGPGKYHWEGPYGSGKAPTPIPTPPTPPTPTTMTGPLTIKYGPVTIQEHDITWGSGVDMPPSDPKQITHLPASGSLLLFLDSTNANHPSVLDSTGLVTDIAPAIPPIAAP